MNDFNVGTYSHKIGVLCGGQGLAMRFVSRDVRLLETAPILEKRETKKLITRRRCDELTRSSITIERNNSFGEACRTRVSVSEIRLAQLSTVAGRDCYVVNCAEVDGKIPEWGLKFRGIAGGNFEGRQSAKCPVLTHGAIGQCLALVRTAQTDGPDLLQDPAKSHQVQKLFKGAQPAMDIQTLMLHILAEAWAGFYKTTQIPA